MNPAPTLAAWFQLTGVLALEILLLVAAATLAGRFVQSVYWRRTIWQVGLLGLLALVVAEVGGIRGGMSGWLRSKPVPVLLPSAPLAPAQILPRLDIVPHAEAALPAVAVEFKAPEPAWQDQTTWWPGLVWLIGFTLLAGRMAAARLLFVLFRHRRQRALTDHALLERVQRLSRRLGVRRQIRVVEMTGLRGPIVFGIMRPCVGVPEGFSRNNSAAQQEVMLAHELAHIAAHDPFWYALADVALTLLWWHPLAWWARIQLRVTSEATADEASLLVKNGPAVLAECLVALGGRLTGAPSPGGIGVEGSAFRSSLGRRVKRLLGLSGQSWRPPRTAGTWLVTTLGPAFIIGTAVAATAWTETGIARGTVREAFWQSALGLALNVALPADRGLTEANPPGNAPPHLERIDWKPWSRPVVEEARAEGKPVLVEFTADWCVTAKVNEQTSLEVEAVRAKLRELGVVTLRADYTVADAAITEELQKFNRAGVPLVLVYSASPDAPPKVLPEVLTPQLVLDALDEATSPAAAKPTPKPEAVEPKDSKNNGPKLILEGKALMEAGKFAEAETKLKEVLKLDPANNAAKQYLAQLQTQQKQAKEAVKAPLARAATEVQSRTNVEYSDAGRRRLMQKLDSIRLDNMFFDGIPLSQVIESLSRRVKALDPEQRAIDFIITGSPKDPDIQSVFANEEPALMNVIVRAQPPLRDVTLRQVLDVIVRCAEQPIKYSIESYAVVFSMGAANPPPLYTRWFKIDSRTFHAGIREMLGTNAAGAKLDTTLRTPAVSVEWPPVKSSNELDVIPPRRYAGMTRATSTPAPAEELLDDARALFSRVGVDFTQPGKQIVYGDRLGMLMTRATLQELDLIEQTIQVLNTPPPQVTIEVKFCEIDEEDGRKLGLEWMLDGWAQRREASRREEAPKPSFDGTVRELDSENSSGNKPTSYPPEVSATLTGILTDPQFRVVLRALEQRQGVNVMTVPKVTTLSGRQAQIKAVEVRYIVTGLNPATNAPSNVSDPRYTTETFELGPVIDVVPYVQADGVTIAMTVIPTIKEFVGYDLDSEKQIRKHYNSSDPKERGAAPAETAIPLPIFRLRQIVTSAIVWDGQTLVLSGGSMTYKQNGKPMSDDAGVRKGAARLFGGQKSVNRRKTLLVFVTPTIIDPAGNRVHPEGKTPFAKGSIPPQKSGTP